MEKIKNTLSQMTLEEKAALCSGKNFWFLKDNERLGIPSIMVTDGPHGLRKQVGAGDHVGLQESVPATCFPTASALAATWNRELVHQVGVALGEECRAENVGVILGPGANIKRSPLCGRNFEYFSEDPYLSGEIAKSHINGVQSQGIGTSLKHYVANNQEYRRMTIDTVVDERALREIYLAGYEIAIKEAQPWTVMCSYNRINGVYASDHRYLMRDILKDEWGHEGLVVTDWGAMNERVTALAAGVELEMPGTRNGNDEMIAAAVREGRLDERVLDQAVERILAMIFKAETTLAEEFDYDRQAHHALARRVAGEGAVLLKNEGDILPLKEGMKVAIIGQFAKKPRYQGAGSSLMNPTQQDNLYDEMVKFAGEEAIRYAPGYATGGDQPDTQLIDEALKVAQGADVVVINAGLPDQYEVEGLDREHMKLPESHDALIAALAQAHPKTVVVLSNGSPVEMPWVGQVGAIVEGHLGGQAGAGGVADVLYGQVNPSGKLAETFPLKLEDTPTAGCFPGGPQTVEYRESIYVGYRYYDTAGCEALFPFGYGLSYTSFAYSDLQLSETAISTFDERLRVSFKVKNTGDMAGKEAVQVYVRDVESTVFRPDKELKGFAKVALQPGEEKEVAVELDRRAFAFYNTDKKDWQVEAGEFEILIGASSRDIRLSAKVDVTVAEGEPPQVDRQKLSSYFNLSKERRFSAADFEHLLGGPLPANEPAQGGPYTFNTPISDMQDSLVGRFLGRMMQRQVGEMVADLAPDSPTALLMTSMIGEAPLRLMLMMGGDSMNRETLEALLLMINGKYFKGAVELIRARRK